MLPSSSRPPKPKPQNPIESTISEWLLSTELEGINVPNVLAQSPKRWTIYEPMVLLPASSFASPAWNELFSTLESRPQHSIAVVDGLWTSILNSITKKSGAKAPLTHLAVNEGIPSHSISDADPDNILRSPTGLRILHGNFGPSEVQGSTDGIPTAMDFEQAFWVSTKQNGIYQTWAPLWTMFSRGNIKEKARLLNFHMPSPSSQEVLAHRNASKAELGNCWAVDMYAGIGYFVFSYAKLGMKVLCWELNPWSVEGLRRGAIGNGWSVKVVQGPELASPLEEMMAGEQSITVFLENNQEALKKIRRMRKSRLLDVRHVNGGLLPTSQDIWRDAWNMVTGGQMDHGKGAWLHLHENVGVNDIQGRRAEIDRYFNDSEQSDGSLKTAVIHVELVKTFAPGVWHCVFDVYISRSSSIK